MERSEIRDSLSIVPGYASLHPGYELRVYVIERAEIIFIGKPEEARRDPGVAKMIEGLARPPG
jgi:hypothetical protein